MKKVLSLVLVAAMIAAFLCTPAFAAGDSKETLVEVTEVTNATVTRSTAPEVDAEEAAEALAELDEEGQKAFEEVGLDVSNVSVTVLDQLDVEIEADKTATMDIVLDGVEDVAIAVFLKSDDGAMKLIAVGNPPLKVELSESGTIVVVLVK